MAKVYKVQIYVTDYNDEIQDEEDLKERLEDFPKWFSVTVADIQGSKEFKWNDDLMINKTYATVDDFEKYFED